MVYNTNLIVRKSTLTIYEHILLDKSHSDGGRYRL